VDKLLIRLELFSLLFYLIGGLTMVESLENEIWLTVKQAPNYEVSNLGRVKRIKRKLIDKNGVVQPICEQLVKNRVTRQGYIHTTVRHNNKYVVLKMHRLLCSHFIHSLLPTDCVDHINGNRGDNTLSNLRLATHSQNSYNKKSVRGYYWRKDRSKWRAQIYVNKKRIYLGYFKTEKEARMAYVKAVLKYHEGFHEQKITKEEIIEALKSI
jgi:hypothetical protein